MSLMGLNRCPTHAGCNTRLFKTCQDYISTGNIKLTDVSHKKIEEKKDEKV